MLTFELNQKVKNNLMPAVVKNVARVFVQELKLKKNYNFSLALVSDQEIKYLNQVYRGQNQVTDVLSFAEDNNSRKFIEAETNKNFIGEIVICVKQAERQAKTAKHTFKQEASWLIVHGLAHLFGYDHKGVSKKKAAEMFELEKRIMKKLNFSE